MNHFTLSIALAFVGYSILNISQAIQKVGLETVQSKPVRGWTIWGAATVASGVAVLVVFGAISLGTVSTVGAMAGTGLVSLTIFSRLVLREQIDFRSVLSIGGIVAGAVLVGAFRQSARGSARLGLLYGVLGLVTVLMVALWLVTKPGPVRGMAIAAFSGFLGAYSQLFQKLSSGDLPFSESPGAVASAILSDPVTAMWVGLSFGSMIVLQFSYRFGAATAIIPSFTAAFIATPVLGGVIIFSEFLSLPQWIGVSVILVSATALNMSRAENVHGHDSSSGGSR